MKRKIYLPTMVQAITVLTVLKMLTNAQTTCNHGLGRVVYERIPDHQLQGFDDDVVRDTMPPFRMLEKCQDLCLSDRTAVNNLVRTCTSFNFQPGVRIASFSGTPEYEESICYLTREQAHPEGIGNLVLVPNSVHFTEVCLTSNQIERQCPNRRYVFERHPRKKLKLLASDHKEVHAANRTDCEERCMNEFTFTCRSVTYNALERTCSMSRFTRRSHPELLYDDPNADYLENTCLSPEKRCDGLAVFVKEENKRLGGPFEVDMYVNISLEECQNQCLRAEKYFCRSIEYDERRRECIVSEEDSISQKDDLRTSSSPHRHLFDLVCLDNPRGEFSDNSVTSHLFSDGRRPDTAFQRYRTSRLGGEFHSEITSRTLSECLDECLRQASFQCRSVVYSERFRVCRLSRFNQRDGYRTVYDADYDYYENLMSAEGDGFGPNYRPDPLGQDTNYHSHNRPPYMGGGSGYPNYPSNPNYPGMNPYPSGGSNYPGYHGGNYYGHHGNYPSNMYPGYGSQGMYPGDRYGGQPGYGGTYGPAGPVQPGYPMGGSGYPPHTGGGYPPQTGGGYPPQTGGGYPPHGGGGGGYPGPGYPDPNYPNKFTSRCDEGDNFRQVGVRLRIRRPFVKRFMSAPSLPMCERECADSREFICRSFNYKSHSPGPYSPAGPERDNCELSDKDSRELDVNNPTYFEINGDYDYFERSPGRQGAGECLDVSQQCSEDGMEFALRTPEGFFGRIYTYGFYERCFFRGNGGTINVLRISGAQGYPECGTQRYGDTMTNIVVVQFSDFVQTGRDKRYNLTCLFRGQGEAVVTSGYIGAGSGSPIPIDYLPAENSLSSKVRLMILYQGRPTTTIAVGDPLTFRLEAQDNYNYPTDIFATNVIARDPYSGRSVQLIDRYGCPVDNYVFPGLDRSREGDGLEARFNAFKIPESNFLLFEATVRTCRDGCQPAYCTGQAGRSEPSFGRRKRDVNDTEPAVEEPEPEPEPEPSTISTTQSTTAAPSTTRKITTTTAASTTEKRQTSVKVKKDPEVIRVRQFASTTIRIPIDKVVVAKAQGTRPPEISRPVEIQAEEEEADGPEEEEFVREMIKVLDSRFDISNDASPEVSSTQSQTVCLASSEYYGLVSAVVIILCSLLGFAAVAGMIYKRYYTIGLKNRDANSTNTSSTGSSHRHTGLGLDRRPFSFLMAASQNFKNRKGDDSPQELITDYFAGSLADIPPPSSSRKGIYDTSKSSRKNWTESNFSKKLKEGTFGKNAGSISRKMFDSLFPKEQNREVVDVVKENPLNCDENFIMSKPVMSKFQDPSEPIYTDPSLFEMERSRSLRSIALSSQGQRQRANDEV